MEPVGNNWELWGRNHWPVLRETSIMHGRHNKDSFTVRSVDNNFITF